MLLCRVLIGDIAVGKRDCGPPLKSDGITRVETLVDNTINPTIFVSTRDYCALPVYYIWFGIRRPKPTIIHKCWARGCSSRLKFIQSNDKYICNCCCKDSGYVWHCPNTCNEDSDTDSNLHPHSLGFNLCEDCIDLDSNSYWHSRLKTYNAVRLRKFDQHPKCWFCHTAMNYVLVGSTQLYNGFASVFCDNKDKCGKQCIGYVWHCPNDENIHHPEGFDLCPDCAVDFFL